MSQYQKAYISYYLHIFSKFLKAFNFFKVGKNLYSLLAVPAFSIGTQWRPDSWKTCRVPRPIDLSSIKSQGK